MAKREQIRDWAKKARETGKEQCSPLDALPSLNLTYDSTARVYQLSGTANGRKVNETISNSSKLHEFVVGLEWNADKPIAEPETPVSNGASELQTATTQRLLHVVSDESGDESDPDEQDAEEEGERERFDIDSRQQTMTVGSLYEQLVSEDIDVSPTWQRNPGVWKDAQASQYIEALILGFPTPSIFLDQVEVGAPSTPVDGLQRLTTIKRFMSDGLRLKGLVSAQLARVEGKFYSELPDDLKRRLKNATLPVATLQPGTSSAAKYRLFIWLNTGGVKLNAQEIRATINHRHGARELIRRCVELEAFQSILTGSLRRNQRMQADELVLMFFAFVLFGADYKKGIKRHLDRSMEKLDKLLSSVQGRDAERKLVALTTLFDETVSLAVELYGSKRAYRRPRPDGRVSTLNKALWVTINTVLAGETDHETFREFKAQIAQDTHELLMGERMKVLLSNSTADPQRIAERGRLYRGVLLGLDSQT